MEGPTPAETVILVAEDDPIVRNLVRTMLTKNEYIVLTANDGLEALEMSGEFVHAIHVLLTDVSMPGMNGIQLAAEVRRTRPEIKVIYMSGYTVDVIRHENQADAFLRKPFIPPTLLKCVQKVLSASGPVDCEPQP
jgi:CheY-like chemotaxis protein